MSEKRDRLKQLLESGEARLHALTFPQRELWEASSVPVSDPASHICSVIHVRGALTVENCAAAIQGVVDRQDVLRLSILPGKTGPLQMVRAKMEAPFGYHELTAAQSSDEGVEELAQEIFAKPFDLLQGPLYRAEVLKRSPTQFLLAFAIHHAIADGWSLGVFVQDLCGSYIQAKSGSKDPLPPLPLTYPAWGAAEREAWTPARLAECASFWKTKLAGAQPIWKPAAVAGPARLTRQVGKLPADLSKAAKALARAHGATLFSTLLAAFQAALAKWSGASDITVGSPVANRANQAVRETMGYCAGNVPMRGEVDSERPFADHVRRVHDATVDSFAHAMPFAELYRALGGTKPPETPPVYQVRFALQNHPVPDVDFPSLSARLQMRSTGTARFHLGCEVTELGEELEVVWLFRAALFPQSAIDDLKQLFQTVLAGACRAPSSRIRELT